MLRARTGPLRPLAEGSAADEAVEACDWGPPSCHDVLVIVGRARLQRLVAAGAGWCRGWSSRSGWRTWWWAVSTNGRRETEAAAVAFVVCRARPGIMGLCPPTWSPRQLRVIGAGAEDPVLAESRAEGEIARREPALPHELLTWVG